MEIELSFASRLDTRRRDIFVQEGSSFLIDLNASRIGA
jgi:hypothetical protein